MRETWRPPEKKKGLDQESLTELRKLIVNTEHDILKINTEEQIPEKLAHILDAQHPIQNYGDESTDLSFHDWAKRHITKKNLVSIEALERNKKIIVTIKAYPPQEEETTLQHMRIYHFDVKE